MYFSLTKVIQIKNSSTTKFYNFLKDRLGEPEGGSEWEPIKILYRGRSLLQQDEHSWSNTSPTRTSQVCQSHVATRVLLTLRANNTSDQNKHSQHAAENCTACCPYHTGQTGGQRQLDW
jgi:hypothetical protein